MLEANSKESTSSARRWLPATRKLQETLRVNEERLQVALSTASISAFNQDLDLRYTWIHDPNPGFTAEKIIGKTDADLLPEQAAAGAVVGITCASLDVTGQQGSPPLQTIERGKSHE